MPTRKQAKDNEERAASFVQADTEQQANDERPATPASVDQATTATTQPASTVPVISNPGKPPKFFEGGSLSAFIKQFSEANFHFRLRSVDACATAVGTTQLGERRSGPHGAYVAQPL